MHRTHSSALAIVLFAFAAGCSPSPSRVCGKLGSLAEESGIKGKNEDKDMKMCVSLFTYEQKSDQKAYGCKSKCIMASDTFKEAIECESSCGK